MILCLMVYYTGSALVSRLHGRAPNAPEVSLWKVTAVQINQRTS
jgi:hypothetical protein